MKSEEIWVCPQVGCAVMGGRKQAKLRYLTDRRIWRCGVAESPLFLADGSAWLVV